MSSTGRTPTHYDVLDVDPRADAATIHAAFRDMATLVHPDAALANSDPEEYSDRELMMKTVNAAWYVLGDPGRRSAYDAAIGLDSPLTRLRLRLRRGARAAGRPRAAAPLRLHRPSLLSRPPLLAEAAALARFAWGTRLGQWMTLLGALAFTQLASSGLAEQLRGPLVLTALAVTGAALAGGGEPTPAADAAHASMAAARLGRRASGRLLRAAAHEAAGALLPKAAAPRAPGAPADRER